MTSARPDTRYLATASITTDIGQRLTNLTIAAPGGYETNSARTAISGTGAGRSIEMIADIDNAQVGVLVDHENGAGYRIRVTAGGVVVFSNSGGPVASITAPNVAAGVKSYVIAWSTEMNPGGSGLTAQRSEFLVYDVAGASLSWTTATHATNPTSASATFTVRGVFTGGVMTLTYAPDVDAVRISSRFHTRMETREHFVAQTAAPSIVGVAACELIPFPAGALTNGNVVGPGYQFAAASMQTGRNRHRLLSPLVQWLNASPPTVGDDMRDTFGPKAVYNMAEGGGWQTPSSWLCRRMVPRHCQWLQVEVQWATWNQGAGDPDLVELRCHAANNSPKTATEVATVTIDRTADDTIAGVGVRQTFAPLLVHRDQMGYTWLYLSGRTDSGSGSGNSNYRVVQWSIVPLVLGDGYNGQPPSGWG
jgi:hypothetical protein